MDLSVKLKKDIFAGIIENENGTFFNTLVHFDKEGLIKAKYRKIHPFSFANEDIFYSSGTETVVTKLVLVKLV